MNRRFVIFGAILIAVIVGLVWWLFESPPSKPPSAGTTPTPQATPVQVAAASPSPPVQPIYEVPAGGVYEGLSDPRWKWWNTMRKVDRSFEWKVPINFYGRAVDQDERPVPGTDVRFVWNDTSARGTSESRVTSDANGRFALTNQKGKGLSVYVSKEGYHTSGGIGGMSFEYAAFFEGNYHRPDPENPVTFRLVKKLDPEPLIARHLSERVTYAQPSYYDVERGTLTQQAPAGAALKLTFERSESPQGRPFDWKWRVDAVNGGLQETKDEFAQLAPENGYVNSWNVLAAANAQPFQGSAQAHFYIRTADNRFARLDVELAHPNSRGMGPRLTINSFLNPAGSRNLEYDPLKQASAR